MLSWKVVTILLLFSSLGSLVPVPGKHFLIETDNDEAEDANSVAVEYGGFLRKASKKNLNFSFRYCFK